MVKTGHGEKMSRLQESAIAALLVERSVEKAANRAGIGLQTLWRWLQQDEFKQSYREARRQVLEHALTVLQTASTEAVECLREVVNDAEVSASTRVTAAKTVLELGIRWNETADLVARVEQLERMLEERRQEDIA